MLPYLASAPAFAIWGLSVLLVAATLLSTVRSSAWWIRIWDYPRLQIAAMLILAAVFQAAILPRHLPDAAVLGLTLSCLAWQGYRIRPYTRLHPRQVLRAEASDEANTLTLIVSNVLQDNRRASDLLRVIEATDPDIVLTLETNGWWDGQLQPLLDRYPYAVRHPLENTYGIHLFSRLELRDAEVRERVTKDIPSIFARVRLRSGRLVALHCLHPEPPQVGNDVAERDAELLMVAKQVARDGQPTVVCGDLNDVAWSHTTRLFQRLSGMLDPRIGRGVFPTFNADYWFARWPLDHVFHDPCFRLVRLEVLPHIGSDHFPILASLAYDSTALQEQEAPAADREDREEATAKISAGREAAKNAAGAGGVPSRDD
ncbi:endonuclease/exonuclease/phosphatase family protein [Sabulicella glaciei]|uniref:Endonuclease/exonuclease/phosphatase family protein n=1 Tax=Sabulicella glaciei TaxID=2984948 RepID=A0ABT3P232_9PROT|nr:endonuclease/exonuclease/phosphatase family protein [Roseococcus sp. MDT2-1-1]MCW8088470.1 endonuclease/exonuclease/phosphatase family protein [Roseococcus sp. MDT2-1-1]